MTSLLRDPLLGFHHFELLKLSFLNQTEQDRQCMYDVTLMRVRITIVAVEKQ
jgi:hypothetical protein